MEKAYDIKELGNKLKGKGLDIAEESLLIVWEETIDWIKESAAKSETPYDDMAMVIVPQLDKLVREQIDKIDGEEG